MIGFGQLHILSQGTSIAEFNLFSDDTIQKNTIIDYLLTFLKSYPRQLEIFVGDMGT